MGSLVEQKQKVPRLSASQRTLRQTISRAGQSQPRRPHRSLLQSLALHTARLQDHHRDSTFDYCSHSLLAFSALSLLGLWHRHTTDAPFAMTHGDDNLPTVPQTR